MKYYEGECDCCLTIIELAVSSDDRPDTCPCCGSEVEYEEVDDE